MSHRSCVRYTLMLNTRVMDRLTDICQREGLRHDEMVNAILSEWCDNDELVRLPWSGPPAGSVEELALTQNDVYQRLKEKQ